MGVFAKDDIHKIIISIAPATKKCKIILVVFHCYQHHIANNTTNIFETQQKIQRKTGSAQQKLHRAGFIPSSDLHRYQVFLRQYVLPPAHPIVQVQHSKGESLPLFQCCQRRVKILDIYGNYVTFDSLRIYLSNRIHEFSNQLFE